MNLKSHLPPLNILAACSFITLAAGVPAQASGARAESPYEQINAEAARAEVTVQPLRGHVGVLMGSGGNVAVLNGIDGKLLADAGISVSRAKVSRALASIDPAPVKYVINTHWHWDHTDGNGWLHDTGATIVAHENTRKHLMSTIRVEEWKHTFDPVAQSGLPTVLVRDEKTIQFDGDTVLIKYYGPSHTDGDLSVYFKKADILATGDTWWNGLYPFIDYVAGGSIDGMIRAADANIKRVTDSTLVIPGHGPVGGRAQLIEYRDMLVAIRRNVASLKHQGKSLEETIAAKPTAPFDARWGQSLITPALFIRLVYRGV